MKKIHINGKDYIKLSELRHEIKKLKETIGIRHGGFSERMINAVKVGYGDIIRAIYKEELEEAMKHAHTPEEIKAVHESIYDMPGDFIVYAKNTLSSKGKYLYFVEFDNGYTVLSDESKDAMVFSYQSKAEEIAEALGDNWIVLDVSEESIEDSKRLLKAIFDEKGDAEDEEDETVEYTKEDGEELLELLAEFLDEADADDDLKGRLFDDMSNSLHRMFDVEGE